MTAIEQIGTQCTGCGACVAICPVSALTMVQDAEGFFYPHVDKDRCTDCGLCTRSCPVANPSVLVRNPLPEQALAGSLKDRNRLAQSASGGAFVALVAALAPDVVYGAAWESPYSVAHIRTTPEQLDALKGSKYIQSQTWQIFSQVREDLKAGKQVLFSGTPCQIAGLQAFLGSQSQPNLTTVELICHGVASPGLFHAYLKYLEKKTGTEIEKVNFREKNNRLGSWEAFQTVLVDQKGDCSRSQHNSFTWQFLHRTISRQCCACCPYASAQRVADFVIGDYWGCSQRNPELYDRLGVSLLFPVTPKGAALAQKLSLYMKLAKIPTSNAIPGNRALREASPHAPVRDAFFALVASSGVGTALKVYTPTLTWKQKLKPYLRPFLRQLRG